MVMIQKFMKILYKLAGVIAGIIMGLMILSNVLGVIARYWFPHFTIVWVEEVSTLGLSFIVGFTLPVLWFERRHLEMDFITNVAPRQLLAMLNILINVFGIAGGVGAIYLGIISIQINRGYTLSILGFDESLRYIPIVILGVGFFLASLSNLIELIKGKGQYVEVMSQDV